MSKQTIPYGKEIFMAFTGFSLWTVTDTFIRALSDFPTLLISCIASIISVCFMCALSPYLGGLKDTFTRPQLKLRLFRGFIISFAHVCAYITFHNLDLTTGYALIFAAPFVAKILSVIITGEKIRPRSWAITTLGFIGVLIVLRPGFIEMNIGFISALVLAFCFGWGYVLTKYIDQESQTFLSLGLFQYMFVAIYLAIPAIHAFLNMEQVFELKHIISIICLSLSGFSGTILISAAYKTGPTQIIAPIHYVQILWGALFSAIFFGEYPDQWTIVGASVIVLSGILLIKYTRPIA